MLHSLNSYFLIGVLIVFLFYNTDLNAQKEIANSDIERVNFDISTNQFNQAIPFDQFFRLNIESSIDFGNNAVMDIYEITPIREGGSDHDFILKYKRKPGFERNDLPVLRSDSNSFQVYMPPLPSKRLFDLYVNYEFSTPELDNLVKIFVLLYDGSSESEEEAKKEYDQLKKKTTIDPPDRATSIQANIPEWLELLGMHRDKFKPEIDDLLNRSSTSYDFKFTKSDVNDATQDLAKKEASILEIAKFAGLLSDTTKMNILSGYNSMLSIDKSENVKPYEFQKRIENLDGTLAAMNILSDRISVLTVDTSKYHQLYDDITQFTKILRQERNVLNSKFSAFKNSISSYRVDNQDYAFRKRRLIQASTELGEIENRAGAIIIPDYGLTIIHARSIENRYTFLPRPYIGLNWHIIPINKDIKLRDLYMNWWKKTKYITSLNVGVTVGGINDNGFSDLYGGFSVIAGMNFRVSRQVRLGLGVSILRENNPNPIIENSGIEYAPQLRISWDLESLDAIPSLISRIFGG